MIESIHWRGDLGIEINVGNLTFFELLKQGWMMDVLLVPYIGFKSYFCSEQSGHGRVLPSYQSLHLVNVHFQVSETRREIGLVGLASHRLIKHTHT